MSHKTFYQLYDLPNIDHNPNVWLLFVSIVGDMWELFHLLNGPNLEIDKLIIFDLQFKKFLVACNLNAIPSTNSTTFCFT